MMSENSGMQRGKSMVELEEVFNNKSFFRKFNKVWVSGLIEDAFQYSHEVFGTKFYKTRVKVKRLSGVEDCVPIIVSESLVDNIAEISHKGKFANVLGRFTSHNNIGEDGRNHYEYFVSVMTIDIYESEEDLEEKNVNLIYLEGLIYREPVFRTTPFGREITDLSVMVDRENYRGKDCIWCIAWENLTDYAKRLEVGDRVRLYGRVQSREYLKRFSPESDAGECRTAYEISIYKMTKIGDEFVDD